ncbi:MAG: class I SAM-dependent methyltransferase [Cyclobacteriaceae bacterium]|nr:class I SAM-dependent methyltransferase [Cyclobacteriaceae bacterium]
MYEKIEKCPICSSEKIKNQQLIKDFSITNELFNISKCENCELLFTNPRPDPENIGKYYASKEYISHSNKPVNLIQYIYKLVRYFALRKKLNIINSLSKKGNILDFGCGTGHFLSTCQKDGWQISGFEPDNKANEIACMTTGTMIYKDILSVNTNQPYNVITLWHVLEHLHDLNGTMNLLYSLLYKQGVLLVAVPNIKSYDSLLYKEYWAAWDVPRHLYHFSQKNIKDLAKKHKFKIKKIYPMKFDSYYVSYLSEYYKNNHNNLLGKYIYSIINGYKSNNKGKEAFEYSSLIYVLTK